MKHSKRLARAFNFTKSSVILLRCWPPSSNANKVKKIIFELSWWAMFISSLCLLFPLIGSIYVHRKNVEIMTKSVCLSCAVSQCTVKMIFCKMRRNKLQNILEKMIDFMNESNEIEKQIMEKCIDQCALLHIFAVIWTYMTSSLFIVGPLLIPQSYPTDAVYPFSLENVYVSIIIYAHQSLAGLQVSAAVLLDCLVAAVLWFVCARFEVLALTIKNCKNFKDMKNYLKAYQILLRYTDDVRDTVDLFVFSTIATSVGGVLFSSIQLVSEQSLPVKGQYAIVAITASLGLFICSWASDNLVEREYLVGIKAFETNWHEMDEKCKTCILHLIMQSQNPIKIRVNSILPTLSLSFFSQFLSTTFRFFAAVRVMIG